MIQRIGIFDAIRGIAILGVVIFHLVWDLEFADLGSGVAFHPVWLIFGRTLAGTFMVLVGVSLVIAHDKQFKLKAFVRRLTIILLAALAITVVTNAAFPKSFIFFGILHAIAAASVIGLAILRLNPVATFVVGVFILVLPFLYSSAAFDTRWLAWIGFYESPPPSNDFVPIFPWAGLSVIGMALTKYLVVRPRQWNALYQFSEQNRFATLELMGRHSLLIYLAHQPILLALVFGVSYLVNN